MGAETNTDYMALKEAAKIPSICKHYLSHHIRNELASILVIAEIELKERREIYQAITNSIDHIVSDMARLGI